MKKKLNNLIQTLYLLSIAAIMVFISACKDDKIDPPVITSVVNYAPAPDDTVVTKIQAGQWVVLKGRNLSGVNQVYFGSIPATINVTYFTDNSIVVQLPVIPFELIDANELNIITAISEGGIGTFNINIIGDPIISKVRNYDESSNDSVIDMLYPGLRINIVGYNLKDATEILFQGVETDLSNIIYTDTSAIVNVPADLSGSVATQANTITYTTLFGSGTFSIKIIGPPSITGVSYETPQAGDSVYLYGYNFVSVQNLTFAGAIISDYNISTDKTMLGFIAPALTQAGPVNIETQGGSFTTVYNVNDIATGALSNFEWESVFKWDWWGGANLGLEEASSTEDWIAVYPEFKGDTGKFIVLDLPVQLSGGGSNWETAIRMTNDTLNAPTWFASDNSLSDPAGDWALKFEMNIPDDWNGSSMVIQTSNSDYMIRYEPWQVTESKVVPYKTNGWKTVTIPFTSFRKSDSDLGDGKGESLSTIKDLFIKGSTVDDFYLYMHNYGADDTKTGFKAAFDNFRVVRR
jgi:hypothetical protein